MLYFYSAEIRDEVGKPIAHTSGTVNHRKRIKKEKDFLKVRDEAVECIQYTFPKLCVNEDRICFIAFNPL